MRATINVNGFEIGGDSSFLVADIGSNHKQDLIIAKESIDAAAEAGANAIKFQSIQLRELYLHSDRNTENFVRKLEFPEEWHYILSEYCEKRNILFFSSPTYFKAVDIMEEINVPLYKIASAQVGTFPQIVEKIAATKKPTLFSTGISSYSELLKVVNIFRNNDNDNFIILHCNSIYPTPAEKVNLNLMKIYSLMFGNPVGFSDHTIGTHIACAAVSLGAKVIEKHFTLSRKLKAPDCSSFASNPSEFKNLVMQIREIEMSKKDFPHRMEIENEEKEFRDSILYRCVANSDLLSNEKLSIGKIKFLRYPEGIDARLLDELIRKGITFKNDIPCGSIIRFSDLNY